MGDKDRTIEAHGKETKKDRVKLKETPKLVHFQVSPCIFFPWFLTHLSFLIAP
jgi:hypothetical protein